MTDVAKDSPAAVASSKRSAAGVPNARTIAERQVLGAVLLEPSRWLSIQQHVQAGDFSDPVRRELADRLWDVCRHDGEPDCAAFLADLPSETLRQTAMELMTEVEQLGDLEPLVAGSVQHLCECRERAEGLRKFAQIHRVLESKQSVSSGEDPEVIALREIQAHARRPDIRRIVG